MYVAKVQGRVMKMLMSEESVKISTILPAGTPVMPDSAQAAISIRLSRTLTESSVARTFEPPHHSITRLPIVSIVAIAVQGAFLLPVEHHGQPEQHSSEVGEMCDCAATLHPEEKFENSVSDHHIFGLDGNRYKEKI